MALSLALRWPSLACSTRDSTGTANPMSAIDQGGSSLPRGIAFGLQDECHFAFLLPKLASDQVLDEPGANVERATLSRQRDIGAEIGHVQGRSDAVVL